MNLKGLQFLNDNQGNRIKAVVDLTMYGKEFAVFVEELGKKFANTNSSNSIFDVNTPPVVGDTVQYVGRNTDEARQQKVYKLLEAARQYIGTPYVTGGTTKSGMDCSGFTSVVFTAIGISLPRVSRDQTTIGTEAGKTQMQAGDLIYFATTTPGRINHVGLVSQVKPNGEVLFIHASSSKGVMEATMSLDYWQKAYMGARHLF